MKVKIYILSITNNISVSIVNVGQKLTRACVVLLF